MSLLMDALRKAEEAKRQAGESAAAENAPSAPQELTLEPVGEAAVPSGSPLPLLSQHLDSVDADLAAVSSAAPARKTAAPPSPTPGQNDSKEAAERHAARNVFAAKQAPKSRAQLWIFLGLGSLTILAIGGYFWWQLQAVSGGSLAQPAPAPARPPVALPPLPPVAASEPRNALPAPLAPLAEPERPVAAAEPARRPERQERARRDALPAAPAQAENPIRLSSSRQKQNPTLTRAYEALQADQLNDARRDYEQVLRSDAKNTDALLGLATIAARQGQSESAAALYLRVLEADPKDVYAQAGLINLKGQGDPALAESRLKTLLASQPESPALNFALGNLYARQTRWSDAQQAYFRAYSAEPDNADYLFNLAVSLDHLHQNKLAAQYYAMAMNAAGNRSAAFDKAQIKSRILELQP
jgi:tetratricopeptide (TPR) repeat protein